MTEATPDARESQPKGDGRPMTAEEQAAFLAELHLCHLACLDDEGYPYVVPVWFEHADGGFYFVARARAAWGAYLQRDSRVSLSIVSSSRSTRILVKGTADIVEEPNVGGQWFEVNRRLSHRYIGGEVAEGYIELSREEPRWLIFVRPQRITSQTGGGWAGKYKHYPWRITATPPPPTP